MLLIIKMVSMFLGEVKNIYNQQKKWDNNIVYFKHYLVAHITPKYS